MEEEAAVAESQVKQGLLDKACRRPLYTAGRTFPAPRTGKSGCARVPGGF